VKGRFVQSSFRLFLDATTPDVAEAAFDADKLIDWENVRRVDLLCDEQPKCPICLEEDVVVPKITRCGHVFCIPCFMRYFFTMSEYNGKLTQRCPVCKADVEPNDLVSVRFQMTRALQVGDKTSFILANHNMSSTIMRVPLPSQTVSLVREDVLRLPTERDIGWYFSRFVRLEPSEFALILSTEVESLRSYRHHVLGIGDRELLPSIDAAVALLEIQRVMLFGKSDALDSDGNPSFVNWCCSYVYVPSSVEELFGDIAATSDELLMVRDHDDKIDTVGVDALSPEFQDAVKDNLKEGETLNEPLGEGEIEIEANPESEWPETENPSTSVVTRQESRAAGKPRTISLYQMIDGRLVFLESFFMKLLLHEHGGYNSLPLVLQDIRIERLNELSITDEIRRRHKYLAHLPLGTQVKLAELDLRSHLSQATKEHFAEEFLRRKEERKAQEKQNRKKANRMSARAAEAEEQFYQSLNITRSYEPVIVPTAQDFQFSLDGTMNELATSSTGGGEGDEDDGRTGPTMAEKIKEQMAHAARAPNHFPSLCGGAGSPPQAVTHAPAPWGMKQERNEAPSSSTAVAGRADAEWESSEWGYPAEPIEDQVSEVLSKALQSQAEGGNEQSSGGGKKKKGRAGKVTKVRLFG